MQGVYVSDQEIDRIVESIKSQGGAEYDETIDWSIPEENHKQETKQKLFEKEYLL